MTKNDRKAELLALFKDIPEEQTKLVDNLIGEVVFLEDRMNSVKGLPFVAVHPHDPQRQRSTAAAKIYKECTQSYMNAVRILLSLLKKSDEDAQNELLKRLEEFR